MQQEGRFALILLLLVTSYLLAATGAGNPLTAVAAALYATALFLAFRGANPTHAGLQVHHLVLLGGTAAAVTALLVSDTTTVHGVVTAWMAVLALTTMLVVVRQVLSHSVVTGQTLLGAVSSYVLLGLFFANVYASMAAFSHTAFFVGALPATAPNTQYFSFVTLTTLGYGDFTSATSLGRAVAAIEALSGQIFLATLVARLVSLFAGPADRSRRTAGRGRRSRWTR